MAIRKRTRILQESHDLGCLRLYREDMRAIATAVAEAGELRMSCTDHGGTTYEATAPEDLDELPEDIGLVLSSARSNNSDSSRSSEIEVRLGPNSATVELVEPDTLTTGILVRISNICKPRQRLMRSMLPKWGSYPWFGLFTPAVLVIAGVTMGNLPDANAGKWEVANTIVAVIAGILVVALVSVGIFVRRPRVILINAPRASRPTYWDRTRDMWWVGIVTALLGVLIGYVLPHS
jgi:hypothetical protein